MQELFGMCSWVDTHMYNYLSVPSLKHLASRKLSQKLLTHRDIRKKWIQLFCKTKNDKGGVAERQIFQQITKELVSKVSRLPLPEIARKLICRCALITQEEIMDWLTLHNMKTATSDVVNIFLKHICWTNHGLINKGKSIMLLFETKLSIFYKYWISCMFAWKPEIYYYWEKMSKDLRYTILTELKVSDEVPNDMMMLYWSCRMSGNYAPLDKQLSAGSSDERYLMMVDNLVQSPWQNYVSMRYFWNKLSEKERVAHRYFFATSALRGYNPNLLSFFLSQMNELEIGTFFHCTEGILSNLIQQGVLFPLAMLLSSYLNNYNHSGLTSTLKQVASKQFFQFDKFGNPERMPMRNSRHGPVPRKRARFVCDLRQIIDNKDRLDMFFNFCRSSEKCQYSLKEHLAEEQVPGIVSILSNSTDIEGDLKLVNEALEWYFVRTDKLEEYKSRVAKCYIRESTKILLNSWKLEEDLRKQEIILYWSLTSMVKVIEANHDIACQVVKEVVPWIISAGLKVEVEECIKNVEAIISWCYLREVEVNQIKAESIGGQVKNLSALLMSSKQINDDLLKVNAILNWCFETEIEIAQFKEQVVKRQLHRIKPSLTLSYESQEFKKANAVLNWCYGTPEEMEELKDIVEKTERLRKINLARASSRGTQIRRAFRALKKIARLT